MTNEEALSIIHCPDTVGGIYSEKYGEALNMAMEALKREPCEDCISRQAAKKIIFDEFEGWPTDEEVAQLKRLTRQFDELPSVTPAVDERVDERVDDCISRQAVVEQLNAYCKNNCKYTEAEQDVMCRACDTGSCIELIEDMPSVTPARARGKWMTEHNRGYVQCSNCHKRVPFCKRSNFCTNCGADMRGDINADSD